MKFGTIHQILNPVAVTWPKTDFFKIQDGGRRHLENRFFGHKSSTDCPISAKFCTRKQNGMLTRATGQKMQMCKIQDGGHYIRYWTRLQSRDQKSQILEFKMAATAILKFAFLVITHRPIVRFRRNFVCGSKMSCRQRPRDKNCKFLKSNMADGHHFENR